MDTSSSRRRFLQTLGLATGALAAGSLANAQEVEALAPKKIIIPDPNNIGPMTTWPARKPGAQYMGGFRAPKLDKVRVAFVGVGERGSMHVAQMAVIEGAEVVGICDLYEDWAKRNADLVEKKTGQKGAVLPRDAGDQCNFTHGWNVCSGFVRRNVCEPENRLRSLRAAGKR